MLTVSRKASDKLPKMLLLASLHQKHIITHMKKHRIAMAGGGTGGHVFPIRSLVQTLFATEHYANQVQEIYRIGTANALEHTVYQDLSRELTSQQTKKSEKYPSPEFHFLPISSGKYRREKNCKAVFHNLVDIAKLGRGTIQAIAYLIKYQIDTVFCKGGYVALPVVIASKLLGRTLIVHESDTRP